MAEGAPSPSYTINGVHVSFPCKAYPSQLSMMDKIIKGLDRSQNCLLESPTGSGKSLALLCSALAWQEHEHDRRTKQYEEECKQQEKTCVCKSSAATPATEGAMDTSEYFYSANPMAPPASLQSPQVNTTITSGVVDIEDADFAPLKKKIRNVPATPTPAGGPSPAPGTPSVTLGTPSALGTPLPGGGWQREKPPSAATPCGDACSCTCDCGTTPVQKRVPKIYFGTRTHKQIAQIARELGKTNYKHARMCILSSREHTCIDPEVSRGPQKNENCKVKLEAGSCRFYDKARKISHRNIRDNGLDTAWDLEQFVGLCQRSQACPYFGSRQLKEGADIIFCPYNYLVDPLIRKSMEISLSNQIVILDEAHNIEDSTRAAASFSITQKNISEAQDDLKNMVDEGFKPEEHRQLYIMMSSFNDLISRNIDKLEGDELDNASKVWTGSDIVAQLKHTGAGPDDLDNLKDCFSAVMEDESEGWKRGRDPTPDIKLRPLTLQALEGLFMVLGYIYRDNMKFLEDYRVAIVRTIVYVDVDTNNRWMGRRRRGHREPQMSYNLHFWCLNPAVAFSDISDVVRSVILTSGTLSPLDTFQSELSAPFPIQLEANHVISNAQVWVGTLSRGPKGAPLLGTYQNASTFAYQDDVGSVVLKVCQTIPFGVLCFLPSYGAMDKLVNRWKATGLWNQFEQFKVVMVEPRSGNKEDFDFMMKEFYEIIRETDPDGDDEGMTGALFFAVCRGKVSEGLDFADNNARAVIAVGIPYPSIKDTQIELKKSYNDQRSATRGLLRGRDWYDIQAFRAINQALGRCIRHRHDWGALILVDERYAKNPQKYTKGLSKWVRKRVQFYNNFQQAENSLDAFTKDRLENAVQVNESMMMHTQSPGDTSLSISHISVSTPASKSTPAPISTPAPVKRTSAPVLNTPVQANRSAAPMSTPTPSTPAIEIVINQHGQMIGTRAPSTQAAPKAQNLQQIQQNVLLINQQPVQQQVKEVHHTPVAAPNQTVLVPLDQKKYPNQYLQLSQAGGFLPSQTATQQNTILTQLLTQGANQTQQVLTQVQAGHQIQNNTISLQGHDQILNFQPPMVSTQIPKTPNVKQSQQVLSQVQAGHQTQQNTSVLQGHDETLDFQPPMASTQIPKTPNVKQTQSHKETPKNTVSTPKPGVQPMQLIKLPDGRQVLVKSPHLTNPHQPKQTAMLIKMPDGKQQIIIGGAPTPQASKQPQTMMTVTSQGLKKQLPVTPGTQQQGQHGSKNDPIVIGSEVKTPKGKLDFGTPQQLGIHKVSANLDKGTKGSITPGKDFKFVPLNKTSKVSPEASKQIANVVRSESPTLFDSDGETNPEKGSVLAERDQNEQNLVTRKPLFKKSEPAEIPTVVSALAENSSEKDKEVVVKRKSLSRLSKSFKQESVETKQESLDASLAVKVEDSVEVKPKIETLDETHTETSKQIDIKPKVEGDKLQNKQCLDDDESSVFVEEESLKTKRQSRPKRRRSSNTRTAAKRNKGIDFDEEADVEKSKPGPLTLCCPLCGEDFGTFTDYQYESHRPTFLKAMKSPQMNHITADMVTMETKQLPADKLCCVKAEGPDLNCHYSVEDGAVLQLLGCARCAPSVSVPRGTRRAGVSRGASVRRKASDEEGGGPRDCLAAQVVVLMDKHNPRLAEGQVWVHPQCVKK